MNMNARFVLILVAAAGVVCAQELTVTTTKSGPERGGSEASGELTVSGQVTTMWTGESGGSPKVVKGAPYSAETMVETTQTLADGTVIHNKQTGAVYRDSEGRTRREQAILMGAPVATNAGSSPRNTLIFVNDPEAGTNYMLDTNMKTAHNLSTPPYYAPADTGNGSVRKAGEVMTGVASEAVTGTVVTYQLDQPEQTERVSLGAKTIEGVQVEGTRTVMTIPAGQIGNDRPIQTVIESWYSPQLQTVVYSKTTDPRMGETVYQLTKIKLSEPEPSLFRLPADAGSGASHDFKNGVRSLASSPKPIK